MATIIAQTSTPAGSAACNHCGKDIPASNFDLHYAHCSRNLEKCPICGDMIPKKRAIEHHDDNHAPVDCVRCGETVERENLAVHGTERCPQRIIACEYCEYQLPAVDLYEHQDFCGNRTEFCGTCSQYVRLCQWAEHELRAHPGPDAAASESPGPDGSAGGGAASSSRMILAVVVTGAAFLLVSIFLHRRTDR